MVNGVKGGRDCKDQIIITFNMDTARLWLYLLWSYCTDKMIMNIQDSHFGGMVFTVGRLVRIKYFVESKVISKVGFKI